MTVPQLEAHLKSRFEKTRKASKGYVRIPCPTCSTGDRKKMKRYVPSEGHTSHCFICKVPLDVQDLLGDGVMFTVDPKSRQEREAEEAPDPRSFTLPGHEFIPVNKLPDSHPAIKFLHKDQLFDLDYYTYVHGICYCPVEHGMVLNSFPYVTSAERLIFPVKYNGQLVGWQARSLPGTFYGDRADCIKYYHVFNKGRYLFNYDEAHKNEGVVVVEGVKKALKFRELGVATFGTGISDVQKQLICQWKQIVVMLDAEEHNNTQKVAREMVAAFKFMGKDVINIDLSHYGAVSPDDLGEDRLAEIVTTEWGRTHET